MGMKLRKQLVHLVRMPLNHSPEFYVCIPQLVTLPLMIYNDRPSHSLYEECFHGPEYPSVF
jgi:hypothetical protein